MFVDPLEEPENESKKFKLSVIIQYCTPVICWTGLVSGENSKQ